MNLPEALNDRALFGALPPFKDLGTWRPWIAFLRAFYGLDMDAEDRELFERHTGRQKPREGGYAEAAVIVGRQSGKTQIASVIGVYEAAQAVLAGARGVYVPLIAQDLRAAQRALFGYVSDAVAGSAVLKGEVSRETRTEIELAGRVTLGVYPCRPASVRGIRAACAVIDELAYFIATDGRPQDAEMLRAIRPTLATTGGRLLILSSPYAQAGALWSLHRKHYGREDSPILVWQATAPAMNPTLPEDYLRRMETDDPEAYRSEVLGEFREGVSTFLNADALAEVVEEGTRERQPVDGVRYHGYVDAASGSGKDSFAVGVAHMDGGRAVLDVCRAWAPPFNPSGVIAEATDTFRRFRISTVEGDKYAPGFVAEGFRRHGLTYRAAKRSTSEMYLEFLPLVNSGAVLLLDQTRLLRQLRGLERKRGVAGRDRIDHRPGQHDDHAVAAAGALVCTAAPRPVWGVY